MKEIIFGIVGFILQAYVIYLVYKKIKSIVVDKEKREIWLIMLSIIVLFIGGIYTINYFYPDFWWNALGLFVLLIPFVGGDNSNSNDNNYDDRETFSQRASREAEDAVTTNRIVNEINNRPSY